MKPKFKVCLAVVFAVVLFSWAIPPAAMAQYVDVARAEIGRVGVHNTLGTVVWLKDLAASPKWDGFRQFYFHPALGNVGYATLLTALSNERTAWVRISGTAEPGSLIRVFYINRQL